MTERDQPARVHLRPVTAANFDECLGLQVDPSQRELVAPNVKSLAQAYVDPNLRPLAIYPAIAAGWVEPRDPMVGFAMYELAVGVGFIMRLMIDSRYQGMGYGRAAMVEVIRRLRLHPGVEVIATSHRRENGAAARLYRSLGFVEWGIGYATEDPSEVYLRLVQDA